MALFALLGDLIKQKGFAMDASTFENGVEFLKRWEKSDLSRILTVNVELIELGLETLRSKSGDHSPSSSTEPIWVSDPLLTPSQAAKELGISWKTLRDSWGEKY